MKLLFNIVSLLCIYASSLTYAAANVNVETCVPCHNTDGNSTVPAWPKIAGQHSKYLLEQLLEYKKGESSNRSDPVMYGIVANMSTKDLEELADFFATQQMSPGAADPDLIKIGEKIYTGGNKKAGIPACIACHGPRGIGNDLAKFPRLAGQHAEYTADQLRKYKKGERSTDLNAIMREISAKMTDTEIEAVSSYVAGLH